MKLRKIKGNLKTLQQRRENRSKNKFGNDVYLTWNREVKHRH